MSQKIIGNLLDELEGYLLGKRRQLEYAVTCMIAGGHLLIEDVPGVGKTTLAKSLAGALNAVFKRVQFTSDLLPSDLIGVTIFHQSSGKFEFTEGPIFTNILLADEINRANPKTQSALLEAMHDAQISHDGETMKLPSPFFVIATQNHKDNFGTFPLPESQLDRFMMKLQLGYPDRDYEKRVISGDYRHHDEQRPILSLEELQQLKDHRKEIHVSDEILDYIYEILDAGRKHEAVKVGVSPRGGQALYRASQALAMVRGREFVVPDDIAELCPYICGHRLTLNQTRSGAMTLTKSKDLFEEILQRVPAPV